MFSISIIGRLCADPELRATPGGTTLCSIRVAVDDRNRDTTTSFVPCVAFGKTGEFISNWFHKGDMIALTGTGRIRTYTDRNGQSRTAFEVSLSGAEFCGGKSDKAAQPAQPAELAKSADPDGFTPIDDNDDLPF